MSSLHRHLQARVIEFAGKLDLGRKPMDYSKACIGPAEPQPRVWYPTLWIDGLEQPIDLPDKGKATVEYRITRKTTTDIDGKKRHDATVEIQSMEPVKKEEKASKLPGAAKQVKLSSLQPRMIFFDDRPRNPDGHFEPQGDGAPDPATMRAAYGPNLGAAPAATGAVAGLGGTDAAAALLAKKLKGTGFGA